MIIGTPLRQAKLDEHYDVIVIGSGIGGMTAAGLLAMEGKKKVLVLEGHYTAGGCTHTFTRKGFEWDVGVHYVGWLTRPNHPFTKILHFITSGNLKWANMGPVYDNIIVGKDCYEIRAGREAFCEKLLEYFPGERSAIEGFQKMARTMERQLPFFFADRILPRWLSRLLNPILKRRFARYAYMTTKEVFSKLTSNQKLIAAICGNWGSFGLPPSESSFAMQGLLYGYYQDGTSYPVGGPSNLAKHIMPNIEKSGGKVVTNAKVERVIINKGSAIGVKLEDGKEIFGDKIISDAGVANTYGDLIDPEIANEYDLPRKLQEVSPSIASLQLFIGLNRSNSELKLEKRNLWIHPNYDLDANHTQSLERLDSEFSFIFVTFPSAKDPSWDEAHPGKATVTAIVCMPYDLFRKWEDTKWRKRGPEYEEVKEKIAARMFEIIYAHVPQLRGAVEHYELSSPISTRHFTFWKKGETYGLDSSPSRFKQDWLRPETPIKNFYLTGQDVAVCGVSGALMGGVFTAISVLGLFRARKILTYLLPWRF